MMENQAGKDGLNLRMLAVFIATLVLHLHPNRFGGESFEAGV